MITVCRKKIPLAILLFMVLFSCTEKKNAAQLTADSLATVEQLKEIKSFYSTPEKEEFKARCITCHSLKYIEMQPAFPRKTWEKIVDKMSKNFGAPIPDSSAKMIVDYLMVIKGK